MDRERYRASSGIEFNLASLEHGCGSVITRLAMTQFIRCELPQTDSA